MVRTVVLLLALLLLLLLTLAIVLALALALAALRSLGRSSGGDSAGGSDGRRGGGRRGRSDGDQGGASACREVSGGTRGSSTGRQSTRRTSAVTTGATATAHLGVLVGNTTLSVEVGSRSDIVRSAGVHTESQPTEDTLRDVVTEEDVLNHGVDVVGFLAEDGILGVFSDHLGVASVRLNGVNSLNEVLVEEHLADVGDRSTSQGVVVVDSGVESVGHDVDVGGAAGVVTREQGVELYDTALVGLVDTAQESVIDVGLITTITVTASDDTGVDTSGVAVPQLEIH